MNLLRSGVQSHINPAIMGKVSTLTNFPLKPGFENYSFLDKAVEDVDMILIPSSVTPLKHENWMHALMKLILCLVQSFKVSGLP